MKIVELLETGPNLADALRAAAEKQMQAGLPKVGGQAPNPNASGTGSAPQGTVSTTTAPQTKPGGSPAQNKPLGIGAAFVAGLTKGKSQQIDPKTGKPMGLGGVVKQGAKNFAASSLGLSNTVSALSKDATDSPIEKPEDIGMNIKAGSMIDLPNVGKIKVTKSTPQGIELDTSQAPGLGVPKLTLNPKDLLKR